MILPDLLRERAAVARDAVALPAADGDSLTYGAWKARS